MKTAPRPPVKMSPIKKTTSKPMPGGYGGSDMQAPKTSGARGTAYCGKKM